ncbi:MAG: hypothetical protein NZ555_15030 [Geminicoccaceae bacterium]|nr:hypothetical protein [Geminicoccaceae bacterium]MCS7267834.1 hypothetical protein [Geminicoccaceae bacterium]MDW8123633.1 hypothetical protein [Geminicoccaceae bacterium]
MPRLRTILLATTVLTFSPLLRAETRLDPTDLERIVAAGLRETRFQVDGQANARADGTESRSFARATMAADRRAMSVRATSRAGARFP